MNKNIGSIDAIVRTLIAFTLAYGYYTHPYPGLWLSIGLIFSGYLIATAVYGKGLLYKMFKISTNKGKARCTGCKEKVCIDCNKGVCSACGDKKNCAC